MSLLVSPAVPQTRDISEDLHLVNHFPFDGKEEDSFAETSLHLSFTDWQLPIDVGSRGNRDVEASYVEAAVGLYDRGKWVADLNILNVFDSTWSQIIPECKSHRSGQDPPIDDMSDFVAIDSWEELLDSPTEVGVTTDEEDVQMTDDVIGHVEWISDDEESDSETEGVIAALKRRSSRKADEQKHGTRTHACNGSAVNRNIVYIL
ncbi:hypothetical protein N0V90_012166 [Kalmusia sp. IMI 367209]|nr:hypothetical protein N0V90_012166 [Kalmusia sp. IMI 367209]